MKKSSVIVWGVAGIFALFALVLAVSLSVNGNVGYSPVKAGASGKIEKGVGCADQCSLGDKYCKDGTSYVCGYYNTSCLIWGPGIPCQYGCWNNQCLPYSCSDTDGWTNIYAKGIVTEGTVLAGQQLTDYCYSGSQVTEHSCISPNETWDSNMGWAKKEVYSCPNGFNCIEGACKSLNTCYDTDGGNNIYAQGTVYGNIYQNGSVGNYSYTDYCYPNGASSFLYEYYCLNSEIYSSFRGPCPSGYTCNGGRCIQQVNQTHLACVSNTCSLVSGFGNNTCSPLGSACGNLSFPDLTVTNLTVSNKTYMGSTNGTNGTINYYSVTLKATVKNIGTTIAGTSNTKLEVVGYNFANPSTIPLAPGSSIVVSANVYSIPQGSRVARAIADSLGSISESNEGNNVLSVNFNLP